MASLIIPIKDDETKLEIEAAFAALYNNPDGLTSEALAIEQISSFILSVVNENIRKQATIALEVVEKNSI